MYVRIKKQTTFPSDILPPHQVFKCAACHKVTSFAACTGVAVCDRQTEVCYVEEETDAGGETVINAGCRLKEVGL